MSTSISIDTESALQTQKLQQQQQKKKHRVTYVPTSKNNQKKHEELFEMLVSYFPKKGA